MEPIESKVRFPAIMSKKCVGFLVVSAVID